MFQRVAKSGTPPSFSPARRSSATAPHLVHDVLRTSGEPLDVRSRAFFEPRFRQDLSGVRVHADAAAFRSAEEVNARAYTVGRDIVFGRGQYAPASDPGRSLLAHELTHVIQQRIRPYEAHSLAISDRATESEAERVSAELHDAHGAPSGAPRIAQHTAAPQLSRANARDTKAVFKHGTTKGTGLQFYPTSLTGTRVEPFSGGGGLQSGDQAELSVIIGTNLTLHGLASAVLPLWNTAAPYTPEGASAPLPIVPLDESVLARALLVYNQYYLDVPAMTRWKAGFRIPLPVHVDDATDEGVLSPDAVRNLAGGFVPAWEPLLSQFALPPAAAPAQADLQKAVATFLTAETTSDGRGVALGTRILTNASDEAPFVLEAFTQLGSDAFDVALAFMGNLVNHQVALFASQRAGAQVLNRIRTILATSPASLSPDRQAALDRANAMLGRVTGIAARDLPTPGPLPLCTIPEPPVDRDITHLDTTFRTLLEKTLADLTAAGTPFTFREGLRSTARQQWLYALGRTCHAPDGRGTIPGHTVTQRDGVAHPGNHQDGRAADCYPVGGGSFKPYADAAVANGLGAGFYWAGFQDPPHVELP